MRGGTSSSTVGAVEKCLVGEEEENKERALKRYKEIISMLPKELEGWSDSEYMYKYEGYWLQRESVIEGIMWVQEYFKPRHEDVLLVTLPKSGTAWFKPLMFSIMNRSRYELVEDLETTATAPAPVQLLHPVLTTSPHHLVPHLELYLHQNIRFPDPDSSSPPRLFHTHIPFASFSKSMIDSRCRIVYVCRNPKDVFVSLFYFLQKMRDKKLPPLCLEKAFEQYCKGACPYGPFWNHVSGFWKANLEWPERVLFMTYEDMKKDPSFQLKRLAEFMGCPFSVEEERRGGVLDKILQLCSFEKLSNLKVNKTGAITAADIHFENPSCFRKGEVGDWKRHLTVEMADRLDNIFEQNLAGSGWTFLHDNYADQSS